MIGIKVSVVVPAYNEEKGIGRVLKEILDNVGEGYEVIVVDDGSVDNTSDITKKFDVTLIRHEKNLGKGEALATGFKHAVGEYIIFIDADATYPAKTIPKMVDCLDKGYDMATGSRLAGVIRGMTVVNRFGNRLISAMLRVFHNSNTNDPLSGLRGIKREYLNELNLTSKGFEIETEFTIKTSKMGLKNIDIPIEYEKRVGKTKLSPLKDGYVILRTIIKYMFIT